MDPIDVLRTAGWFPGRVTPIGEVLARMQAAGFAVSEAAEQFLTQHSGLALPTRSPRHDLWFDGVQACSEIDPGWTAAYGAAEKSLFTPVGGYSHMTILVTEDGSFWGSYDDLYGPLASTREELVSEMLTPTPTRMLHRQIEAQPSSLASALTAGSRPPAPSQWTRWAGPDVASDAIA